MTHRPLALPALLAGSVLLSLACSGSGLPGFGRTKGTTSTRVPSSDGETIDPNQLGAASRRQDPDTCEPPYETPAPQGCVMDRIACGDTIQGNNRFGTRNFGNAFYVYNFCTPQRLGYDDSPEAIYQITVPGDKKAIFHLTSDCAELDISAMSWSDPTTCPTDSGRRLNECEMAPKTHGESVSVATVTNPQDYIVAIDGRNGDVGNFTLHVECVDYR